MRLPLALALLFAPSVLAQTAPVTSSISSVAPGQFNCPVDLRARQIASGSVLRVSHAVPDRHPALTVLIRALTNMPIQYAEGRLIGQRGSYLLPASAGSAAQPPTESFVVTPSTFAQPRFHSVVHARQLTSVQWVDLDTVRFINGSTWHRAAGVQCRVEPVGLLLVN